jgi:hypothetical protein
MTDQPIIPDTLAVRGMSDGLKQSIVTIYRELADSNARLGFHDLAAHCAMNAAALDFGGEITLMEAAPCSE